MPYSSAQRAIRELPFSVEPADRQLAGGPALLAGLEAAGAPALRWYGMRPTALIVGSSQRLDELDAAACAAAGVRVHRRRSGGGAVLSDAMLMLDLAIPRAHPLYLEDVSESYRWIGAVWVAALRELGTNARAIPVDEARADAQTLDPLVSRVCFGGLSPYETLLGWRKLVGLAQIRRRAGALYQAGMYLRWAPERTARLMAGSPHAQATLARQLTTRVVGLDAARGGQALDAADVARAFEAALAQAGLVPAAGDWSDEERARQAAEAPRYAALEA